MAVPSTFDTQLKTIYKVQNTNIALSFYQCFVFFLFPQGATAAEVEVVAGVEREGEEEGN